MSHFCMTVLALKIKVVLDFPNPHETMTSPKLHPAAVMYHD